MTFPPVPGSTFLSARNLPAKILWPSGDETGATDSAAITASTTSNAHTILAPGEWYLDGAQISQGQRWLQGSGTATVLNVVTGATGLTVAVSSAPGLVYVSDMMFNGGAIGLEVAGADESWFRNLFFTGQTTASIDVDGDDATETHFSDIGIRETAGIGFNFETAGAVSSGSGGLYLARVRCVTPASTCTNGFRFVSTAAADNPTGVFLFMSECVADGIFGDAMFIENVYAVLVTGSWFTVASDVSGTPSALHVTGGYQHSYQNSFFYNPSGSYAVTLDGAAHEIQIGAGSILDGAPTALSIASAGANILVVDYWNYCAALADNILKLSNFYSNELATNFAVPTGGSNVFSWSMPPGLYFVTVTMTIEATGAGNMDGDMQIVTGGSFTNVASATLSGPATGTAYLCMTLSGIVNVLTTSSTLFVQVKGTTSVFTVLADSVVYGAPGASQVTMTRI